MATIQDVAVVLRDRIAALGADVVGRTYAYQVVVRDWGKFRTGLIEPTIPGSPSGGHARWWTVHRRARPGRGLAEVVEQSAPVHQMEIHGYDGSDLEGSLQPDFQILVDRVAAALTPRKPRETLAEGYFQLAEPDVEVVESGHLENAGGALVHHARLSILVEERRATPGGAAWRCR